MEKDVSIPPSGKKALVEKVVTGKNGASMESVVTVAPGGKKAPVEEVVTVAPSGKKAPMEKVVTGAKGAEKPVTIAKGASADVAPVSDLGPKIIINLSWNKKK